MGRGDLEGEGTQVSHQGEVGKRIWDSGPACRVVVRCDLPRALGVLGTGQCVWGENDTDGREVRGFLARAWLGATAGDLHRGVCVTACA